MGVDTEREARVGVPEVLSDGLHRLAGVDEHGGVEVAQRVHAVRSTRLDVCRADGWTPDPWVEVGAVERLVLPAREEQSGRHRDRDRDRDHAWVLPRGLLHPLRATGKTERDI